MTARRLGNARGTVYPREMHARPGSVIVAAATVAAATAALGACEPRPEAGAGGRAGAASPPAQPELLSCVDLPRDDPRSNDLSGLAWDGEQRLLYAISDRRPQITVLAPRPGASGDFSGYELRAPIPLSIELGGPTWDGEALAIARDRFLLVAQETSAAVFSVDRAGGGAAPIAIPRYPGMRDNKGLEGLGYAESAEGRYLFVANEQALEGDGPTSTAERGTVVRILRHRLDAAGELQVAYQTEPVFAAATARGPSDNGVSDLAALSPERVLVMERAFVPGAGNAIRIYQVDLRGAQDVTGVADARAAAPVAKRLVLDLARLPDGPCAAAGPAPRGGRRALENYEGLAVGPLLEDGRRVLFLISDDNCCDTPQRPRLLALALPQGALE